MPFFGGSSGYKDPLAREAVNSPRLGFHIMFLIEKTANFMIYFLKQNHFPGLSPRFISEPQSLTVKLGQTAFLGCSLPATPSSAREVTWTSDGEMVTPEEDRVSVLPSGALVIKDVRLSDRAEYRYRTVLWLYVLLFTGTVLQLLYTCGTIIHEFIINCL